MITTFVGYPCSLFVDLKIVYGQHFKLPALLLTRVLCRDVVNADKNALSRFEEIFTRFEEIFAGRRLANSEVIQLIRAIRWL